MVHIKINIIFLCYNNIIEMEIEPLIREYWFDDEDTAEEQIKKLKSE